MRKFIGTFSLIVAGVFTSQIAKADACNNVYGNLVSNCSFETGDFTGWTGVSNTDSENYVTPFSSNGLGATTSPYSGAYFASLGNVGSTLTLSQTITTKAGDLYDIIFALTNDTSGSATYPTASFLAAFGGATLLNQPVATAQTGYTLYSYIVAATGTSTTLSFTEENDTGEFGLDSVSVSEAPEPSSIILLGTGALGLVNVARRRLNL